MKGHVTASAFVLSDDRKSVLLHKHKILDRWLNFGGHTDDSPNIFDVALREAEEESGISSLEPISNQIFDVDVHMIPQNKSRNETQHEHHDMLFIFLDKNNTVINYGPEGSELRWVPIDEVHNMSGKESHIRVIEKLKKACVI